MIIFLFVWGNTIPYLAFMGEGCKEKNVIEMGEVIYSIVYTVGIAVGMVMLSLENMAFVEKQKRENTEYYNDRKICFVYDARPSLIDNKVSCQILYRLDGPDIAGGDILYFDKTEVNRCVRLQNTFINCWVVENQLIIADHINDVGFQEKFTIVYIVLAVIYFVHCLVSVIWWIRILGRRKNKVYVNDVRDVQILARTDMPITAIRVDRHTARSSKLGSTGVVLDQDSESKSQTSAYSEVGSQSKVSLSGISVVDQKSQTSKYSEIRFNE